MTPEENKDFVKPWRIAALVNLIEIYQNDFDNPTGGLLHIVLSDGNVDNADVEFCIAAALSENDHLAVAIGRLLLELTNEKEREQLYENNWRHF